MCGICGEVDFFYQKIDPLYIRRMCRILGHRGPDDEGMVFIKDNICHEVGKPDGSMPEFGNYEVALGHRRLSIIDLSDAAHQPMPNEDRSIWIVFNGEIYNFQELRRELTRKGHLFRSQSDTEAIIHAYETWDIDCLHRLRGMFAFAIWDCKKKRLFIARDRLGKKPVVFCKGKGRFVFASEAKAILEAKGIERRINDIALHNYLTFQYIPAPNTIFESIQKLPPAHYLLYDASDNVLIERYWRLRFGRSKRNKVNLSVLCDELREKLEESVKLRLVSDVPIGAFLSGGIDSSIVVGLMASFGGSPVKTFSVGFDEKHYNELHYARLISKCFGTEHHEFIVKPNAIEVLEKLVWFYNEPFADSSAIPTYYVANMTKDFVKVVLTGDAGDESFAGYRRYLRSRWIALFTKLPSVVRKACIPALLRFAALVGPNKRMLNRMADFAERLEIDQAFNYYEQIKIFNDEEKKQIYTDDLVDRFREINTVELIVNKFLEAKTDDLLEKLLYTDIHSYLPEDLLVKVDIATMANSIEARVPFLDHELMELVASIPVDLKIRGNKTKYILKKAFRDLIPKEVLSRKKMGFGVPVSEWFRNELKQYVYEILLDERTIRRGFFRRESLERLLNEHVALSRNNSAKIWALLFLEIWFRVFIDR